MMINEESDNISNGDKGDFYKDAAQYWSQVPATVDGMLGGFGHISTVDIQGSTQFLKQLFRLRVPPGQRRALDCGAGIGRITKNLLFNHFQTVDLVEQNPAFVAEARAELGTHKKMGHFYCAGLQEFHPQPGFYDVIWCQWVLGHLTDEDLISFLSGCICGLRENGIIIIKENTTTTQELDLDRQDSSVTRPLHLLCDLLQKAGLRCVKQKRQVNFPHGLYPVYMIATRPSQEKAPLTLNPDKSNVAVSPEVSVHCQLEGCSEIPSTIVAQPDESSHTQDPAASSNSSEFQESKLQSESNPGSDDVQVYHVSTSAISVDLSDSGVSLASTESVQNNFEQEASDFNSQVEYSSDDSTKTDEISLEPNTIDSTTCNSGSSSSPRVCDIV